MSVLTQFLGLFKWNTSDSGDLASNFDIDRALNDNWDKIDAKMQQWDTSKQNSEAGKGLSTNDYTDADQNKLSGIATGAQINVLENLVLNGETLEKNNKAIDIKDSEVTNARASATKSKTFANVKARLEEIEDDISNINSSRGHIYGIKRKISANSSSSWERTNDAVGLVANATKTGASVINDFDNLYPWKDIISFNLDLTTKKKKAYYGDADFKFDGTNGDVYTHIPKFWIKVWQENDYDYIQIADYDKSGFTEINEFDIARYQTGLVDNVLHSYNNLVPAFNKTLPQFRTLAKAIGNEFCLMDWRYFTLQFLYLVEYANYNSQETLGSGFSAMRYSNGDVALVAENAVNRFIVNNSGGSGFYVGQTISIGTSAVESFAVASSRKITAINNYSEGDITGKEIIFDGEPVNIALTNVIWSSPQHSGSCDTLGMKSGCLVNDNKHGVIYRGIENIFGNIFQWVDGINISNNQAWICKEPADYVCDKFESPYTELGYVNANANGYSKTLGYDINEPLIKLPTEIGGSSSTYMDDYYYQNTGNRVARVGGFLVDGASDGLWCWTLYSASSSAYWYFGARVLKYQ